MNWKNLFWSVATACVSAAVMYATLPYAVFLVTFLVILCHELGHVIVAKILGARPMLPIFIPLIFVTIGRTKIFHLPHRTKEWIYIAGPLVGILVASLFIIIGFKIACDLLISAAIVAMMWEIFSATCGSDGRKYRKSKKERKNDFASCSYFNSNVNS